MTRTSSLHHHISHNLCNHRCSTAARCRVSLRLLLVAVLYVQCTDGLMVCRCLLTSVPTAARPRATMTIVAFNDCWVELRRLDTAHH